MHRYELTNEQWALLEDLFPKPKGSRGRPRRDDRQMLNGILHVLHTGVAWRDLPERYGPWQTVYDRFRRWQREGLFDRLLERLQIRLDERGLIDFDLWLVDATVVRASRAAAGARKKGGL